MKILPFVTQSHSALPNLKNIQTGKLHLKTNPYYNIAKESCSVLRYLSVTIVTLYPVRHDRYMIVKVHSYVKVVLLIPSTVL